MIAKDKQFTKSSLKWSDAVSDIYRERERQKTVEGWTAEHDDTHNKSELAFAAASYALPSDQCHVFDNIMERLWPFEVSWFKPKDRRSDLVRAAALIVAEIERLDRAASRD